MGLVTLVDGWRGRIRCVARAAKKIISRRRPRCRGICAVSGRCVGRWELDENLCAIAKIKGRSRFKSWEGSPGRVGSGSFVWCLPAALDRTLFGWAAVLQRRLAKRISPTSQTQTRRIKSLTNAAPANCQSLLASGTPSGKSQSCTHLGTLQTQHDIIIIKSHCRNHDTRPPSVPRSKHKRKKKKRAKKAAGIHQKANALTRTPQTEPSRRRPHSRPSFTVPCIMRVP